MPSTLLTTGHSRWVLHGILGLLSVVAIATSAPSSLGGVEMLQRRPGDIRGVQLLGGSITLGTTCVLRAAYVILPRPWRIYLDRLEFTALSIIWIAWTSATMAFSAFTITEGVCSTSFTDILLPTCPLLTFDLILLHLLSVFSLCLLLIIISTTLSPGYYRSHSTVTDGKDDPGSTDAFVMWDLALASPPASPRLGSAAGQAGFFKPRTYGTAQVASLQVENDDEQSELVQDAPAISAASKKRDKFAEGRVASYVALMMCSTIIMAASIVSLRISPERFAAVSAFLIAAASTTIGFAGIFLARHWQQRKSGKQDSAVLRKDRILEFGFLGALFLLWPVASIVLTLFPPTSNRPCTNPAASLESPDDLPDIQINVLCMTTTTAVTLGWLASWLLLARVAGLIVPMPDVGRKVDLGKSGVEARGEEGRSLLRIEPVAPVPTRPQVGWGRIVAGEAFELGDDDDE